MVSWLSGLESESSTRTLSLSLSFSTFRFTLCFKSKKFCAIILLSLLLFCLGARCSSVVRVFAHGTMGHQIDPSRWTHCAISYSIQCSTTGVTKAVVCVVLSVG